MAWTDFEHQIWKALKKHELDDAQDFIVAVSGGIDSMALLNVMLTLKPQAHFTVAHFHHGDAENAAQQDYRDRCVQTIADFIEKHSDKKISFITEKSKTHLKSEAEMRDGRWSFIQKLRDKDQPILTAHHLDDWVETLTLKLIRGVGVQGFTAFRDWDGIIFRPFLRHHKTDLQAYAEEKKIGFVEDPSNDSDQYLRNWLRHEWFRSLDEKNPSGYQNYSRSLLQLQQALQETDVLELQFFDNNHAAGLDRNWFFSLSEMYQLKALAQFLRSQNIFSFTTGQLKEIKKRLDKNQKDLTFTVINVKWVINASQIMIEL